MIPHCYITLCVFEFSSKILIALKCGKLALEYKCISSHIFSCITRINISDNLQTPFQFSFTFESSESFESIKMESVVTNSSVGLMGSETSADGAETQLSHAVTTAMGVFLIFLGKY